MKVDFISILNAYCISIHFLQYFRISKILKFGKSKTPKITFLATSVICGTIIAVQKSSKAVKKSHRCTIGPQPDLARHQGFRPLVENGVKCMSNYSELSTYHEYDKIVRCHVQFSSFKGNNPPLTWGFKLRYPSCRPCWKQLEMLFRPAKLTHTSDKFEFTTKKFGAR